MCGPARPHRRRGCRGGRRGAGLGRPARRSTGPALAELAAHGVRAAGVVEPGDEPGERRLRQLGLDVVVRTDLHGPRARRRARPARRLATEARGAAADEPAQLGGPRRRPRGRRLVRRGGPTGARRGHRGLGSHGGPGRSTVALNLAAELAWRRPTLLVDCDTYGASVAQSLGLLDEAPGMAAAAGPPTRGRSTWPRWPGWRPRWARGLRVLTGIPRAERWTELRAPRSRTS